MFSVLLLRSRHALRENVTGMLLRQRAVIEFLVKEGTRQESSTRDFFVCMELMEWHHTTSPKRRRWKQLPRPAKLWELPFGLVRDVYWSIFWKNRKDQCSLLRSDAQQTSSCASWRSPKKKTVILQHDNARPHTVRLTLRTIQKNECELLSYPTYSPDLAPWDFHLLGPVKGHWWGSPGSRAKLVARSWNGHLPKRHFYYSVTLREMHKSGCRFCIKLLKTPRFYWHHLFLYEFLRFILGWIC
jgi:hypothetical protein